jgi:dipeptidyl aminopeptidase/acylaminoacyl peptidase
LYLLAEHEGRVLPYHLQEAGHLPLALVFNHSTTSISVLPKQILLSMTSHTNPLDYYLLPEEYDSEPRHLHRLTNFSAKLIDGRLDSQQGEEFWFEGDEGIQVMGWINRPPGFKEGQEKKWPMAFLVHGGPQGAWEDSWSTRWNPALFAAQGYVVIAINPTGSTGYGQEFSDRIQGNWGSRKPVLNQVITRS